MRFKNTLLLLSLVLVMTGCGIYSFTGASVSSDIKTFQVNYFENNAPLVEPGLERDFKLALEDLIQNQTNLSLVTSGGDLLYEGEITDYRISPTTSTSQNTAAQNRLTISVKISFYNDKKDSDNLENKTFSFFYDFPGSSQLSGSQKVTAHEAIFERLTQDIFNATLARW